MFFPLLAVVALHAYASTPQGAAVQAVDVGSKSTPIVRRLNIAGAYAAVLTSGGVMEGSIVSEPILVQRFSFGWQALDLLNSRCGLDVRSLGERVDALLLRNMPALADDRPCRPVAVDVGPLKDVVAVRRLMRGPLVPSVLVSGNWALGTWYGAGGGESLYKLLDGRWRLVASGGGAMGVDEMRVYGVPRSSWCQLRIYDAKC
jgi:hypothetical protein